MTRLLSKNRFYLTEAFAVNGEATSAHDSVGELFVPHLPAFVQVQEAHINLLELGDRPGPLSCDTPSSHLTYVPFLHFNLSFRHSDCFNSSFFQFYFPRQLQTHTDNLVILLMLKQQEETCSKTYLEHHNVVDECCTVVFSMLALGLNIISHLFLINH